MIARPDPATLEFRLGEFGVRVRSDLREVVTDLARLYRPTTNGPADETRAIRIDVKAARRLLPGRRYDVTSDGEVINRGLRRREVLPHLEWGINWRLINSASGYLLVHAASMVREGRGVVFAGASGSGKSTLVAALLRRGWEYLCDEFALIHPQTLRLHPFPKAICVKSGSFDLMRRLDLRLAGNRHYVKAIKGTVGYIAPRDVTSGFADPVPARAVVVMAYDGHAEPRLRRLAPASAAFSLLNHAVNRNDFGARAVDVIGRFVAEANCFGLEPADLDETANLLESAL